MFHWMRLRAFVYATEDREKVMEAISNTGISGDIGSEIAEGAYGDRIEIIEVRSARKRDVDRLFSMMKGEDIGHILETLEERMDSEGVLHFRLDKQELYMGIASASRGGDVISVEIKVRAYPSSRERAIGIMREYLEGFL